MRAAGAMPSRRREALCPDASARAVRRATATHRALAPARIGVWRQTSMRSIGRRFRSGTGSHPVRCARPCRGVCRGTQDGVSKTTALAQRQERRTQVRRSPVRVRYVVPWIAQMVRASDFGSECRGFDSRSKKTACHAVGDTGDASPHPETPLAALPTKPRHGAAEYATPQRRRRRTRAREATARGDRSDATQHGRDRPRHGCRARRARVPRRRRRGRFHPIPLAVVRPRQACSARRHDPVARRPIRPDRTRRTSKEKPSCSGPSGSWSATPSAP